MGYCSGYDIKSYLFNFIVRVVAVFPSHPLDGINQPENISFNTHNTCFYKNRMSTNSLLDLAKNLSPTRAPTPYFISYFLLNRYFRRLSIIYPKLMKNLSNSIIRKAVAYKKHTFKQLIYQVGPRCFHHNAPSPKTLQTQNHSGFNC